jgi:heme/copper-type cytochrome/quinol oxidase subunit 2
MPWLAPAELPMVEAPHIPDAEKADIGVLLVHGIGDQGEADALLSLGEPLIDWLREWLTGDAATAPERARGTLHVNAARLRAVRTEAVSPAFARVDLDMPGAQGGPRLAERWLFAEAWWGDAVQVPGTARLLAWMFTRLPLIVMWHFFGGRHEREAPGAPARSLWEVPVPKVLSFTAKALLTPVLIVLMQCVVAVALLLWLLPFGAWRQALLSVVRVLTLTLGDSYVLLEQDVQRAALVSRITRHLAWLRERVGKVVVIAHSQGGAIAHAALVNSEAVALFITVGSGLEKLEFLRLVRDRRSGLFAAAFAAPCLAVGSLALLAGWLQWVPTSAMWAVTPLLILAFGAALAYQLVVVMKGYREALAEVLAASPVASGAKTACWYDVYATMDLVPMGRASQLPRHAVVVPVELRNECSLVSDHVSYFAQRCGFAAWCWGRLAGVSSLPLFNKPQLGALQQLGLWHARRAFVLSFGTWLAPLSIALSMLVFPNAMAELGGAIFAALKSAELNWPHRMLHWLMLSLARAIGWLLGLSTDAASLEWRGRALMAATLAAVAVGLWWLAVVGLWRHDSRARWRAMCKGVSTLVGAEAMWLGLPMLLLWCLAAMLPVLTVLWAAQSPDALSLGSLGRATATLVASMFLLFGLVGGWVLPWLPTQDVEQAQLGRVNHPLWPLACALAMAFWGAAGVWLWGLATGLVAVAALGSVVSWLVVLHRGGRVPAWVWALILCVPAAAVVLVHALTRSWQTPPSIDALGAVHAVLSLALVGLWRWWRARPVTPPS